MERKHKQKLRLWLMLAVDAAFLVLVFFLVTHARISLHFEVLSPGGVIAAQQRRLLVTAVSIMLIAAVPVYILIFYFIAKYRADRQGAAYEPDLQSGKASTFALWAVPVAIILALSVINWNSSHALDPYKPIASGRTPVTIQVVALQWKWLFIYPEQGIATVNFVEFPAGTPVNFRLTADAPMNSFWIPELGSQMYAMAGMETQLNLQADHEGTFNGRAAEINGAGFSGMAFAARAVSEGEFENWIASVKKSGGALTMEAYGELSQPSADNPPAFYASAERGLYNGIMTKYMGPEPMSGMPEMNEMHGH